MDLHKKGSINNT